MSPSSIPREKRYCRFLAGSGPSSLLRRPIHSTYASACICALLEMGHWIQTRQALPAETLADARLTHVSRKTSKSENAKYHYENQDVSFHGDFVRPAISCRRSLSPASSSVRNSRNARMQAADVASITPVPSPPLISTTCVGVLLARALPINMRKRNDRCRSGGFMSLILVFARKWVGW